MGHIWRVSHGDCRAILPTLGADSVDSVVTDPPYELGFMGRKWDASGIAYDVAMWREVLRVLKPGGHLLAFGGTRTYHRMACAIEDAGFEIRDSIHWVYGSGFPKSLDVSKAIDREAGAVREVVGERSARLMAGHLDTGSPTIPTTIPTTEAAKQWDGWGTALKPAHEPIVVARKPLAKGHTVAANVIAHGVGGVNVDGCRARGSGGPVWSYPLVGPSGRWPPNFLLSHLPECDGDRCAEGCPVAEMDAQSGTLSSGSRAAGTYETQGYMGAAPGPMPAILGDSGGASRFFPVFRYEAKASTSERGAGLPERNGHPTVKPIDLMRWLVRLVTPRGGLVFDPFTGSGTTGCAAVMEGMRFEGIEQDEQHAADARARIDHWAPRQASLFDLP